jgi:Cytochrome P450
LPFTLGKKDNNAAKITIILLHQFIVGCSLYRLPVMGLLSTMIRLQEIFDFEAFDTSSTTGNVWQSNLLVLPLSLVTVLVFAIQSFERKRLSRLNVPFMKKTAQGSSWPFVGQALTFLRHTPWDLLTQWHRDAQSPIIGFWLLGTLTFSVASPSLCKAILQSKISHTKKDVENSMKPFLSILGTGIVTSEGDAWFHQRRNMSHPLRFDVLQYIPIRTMEALERLFDILDAAAEARKQVPIGALLRHLTLQVISGTFLSLSAEESDKQFATLYLPIVEECNVRVWHPYRRFCFFLPSFWRYHSNVYRLNAYVSSLITKRWKNQPPTGRGDTHIGYHVCCLPS